MSRKYRCAVYTRKSTEEGLDQEFNSLDAQRESCEAYIKSQKHEGWKLLPDLYDDGGISGGTMKRPALQRLLDEVRAGRVDIIVVYKVDRLTRALSDFAKMVELFDEHDASFVSVTQQFNTTTSMGRLTLNVLLSFAQFEREVTGERIRDKIAASMKRGMWMGGPVPLGYDNIEKKLVVNEAGAETVRALFRLYLEQGNVRLMKREADRRGLRSRVWINKAGKQMGDNCFARGHLYLLLSNPIYIGEVTHKGERYDGMHDGIIDREIWDAAQALLRRNAVNRLSGTNVKHLSLLAGLLWDADGVRLMASQTNKGKRNHRYYISAHDKDGFSRPGWYLPAKELECVVIDGLNSFLNDRVRLQDCLPAADVSPATLNNLFKEARDLTRRLLAGTASEKKVLLQKLVNRIDVGAEAVVINLYIDELLGLFNGSTNTTIDAEAGQSELVKIHLPVKFRRRARGEKIIISASGNPAPSPDPQLIKAVAKGHGWFSEIKHGSVASLRELAEHHGVDRSDTGRILRLAFLAPDIVEAILQGRQSRDLTYKRLMRLRILPVSWAEQRESLGFPG